MKVKCPNCNVICNIDNQYANQQIQCPNCENFFEAVNPNLFSCPDCFELISKRASMCPHCGAALRVNISHEQQNLSNVKSDISTEENIEIFHPSAMNYLWGIILGIITLPIVIGLFILLYIYIDIHYTKYELTSHRIIICRGLIAKFQNEIWIKDMRAVNLNQGIWQRIIGVGNISIGTAATAGTEICITGISNPQKIIDKINALRVS